MSLHIIMYISKAITRFSGENVPVVLPEIYRSARTNNSKNGLTGVLSYSNGYYLQVLEGEEVQVKLTLNSIVKDTRHSDLVVLIDTQIEKRSFEKWSMRLVGLINHDAGFSRFLNRFSDSLTDPKHIQLLRHFSIKKPHQGSSSEDKKMNGFNGTSVMLQAWPDFNLIKPTSEMIELCALLISKPCRYEKIIRSIPTIETTELDKFLKNFSEMGILKMTGFEKPPESPKINKKESGFFLKMKQFLNRKT